MNDVVYKAMEIAEMVHADQYRHDGNTPYIAHINTVVDLLPDNSDLKVIGYLHDVIEGTEEDFNSLVGQGIPIDTVKEVAVLTKNKGQSYEEYISRIRPYKKATAVKIADIVSNLTDKPTKKQIKKYYKALVMLMEG